MGNGVKKEELKKIAGSVENVFFAKSFDLLAGEKFIKTVQKKACEGLFVIL